MEILCFRGTRVNIVLREYQRIIDLLLKGGGGTWGGSVEFGDFRKYARYGHNLF